MKLRRSLLHSRLLIARAVCCGLLLLIGCTGTDVDTGGPGLSELLDGSGLAAPAATPGAVSTGGMGGGSISNGGINTGITGTGQFGGGSPGAPPELGATQGGVQDMGLARQLVQEGVVPPPEAFLVEAMFSEHELGMAGEPCDQALCLRAALGFAPDANDVPAGWLQIGMGSNVDPDTYVRPSLTVVFCVDVSGSMNWSYVGQESTYEPPAVVAQQTLVELTQRMTADDQVAIVTFEGMADTLLNFTPGDDQESVVAAIDALHDGGGTNMEAGLQLAFNTARNAAFETDETRVILITDMQPNVGGTTPRVFDQLVSEAAMEGIGLTIVGTGIGLGPEVMAAVAGNRGGNAFSLFTREDVDALIEDSWPWMVSPIAHDLRVSIDPGERYEVVNAHGFPAAGPDELPGFEVSTVFLSRRGGALLLQVAPSGDADLLGMTIDGELSYENLDGEAIVAQIEASHDGAALDESGRHFEQPSVARTVALALLTRGMRLASEQYADDPNGAVVTLTRAIQRFEGDTEGMSDPAMTEELDFARQLLNLMESGAQQGTLYSQF